MSSCSSPGDVFEEAERERSRLYRSPLIVDVLQAFYFAGYGADACEDFYCGIQLGYELFVHGIPFVYPAATGLV